MDKAGNFIGWLHIDGVNLSVALVENALSKVHFTAERSAYYKTLVTAEEACRQRKEKVGANSNCLKHECNFRNGDQSGNMAVSFSPVATCGTAHIRGEKQPKLLLLY